MRYFDDVIVKLLPRKQMTKIKERELAKTLYDQQRDVAALTVYLDKYLDQVLTDKTCGSVQLVCIAENFSAKCLLEHAGFSQAHRK